MDLRKTRGDNGRCMEVAQDHVHQWQTLTLEEWTFRFCYELLGQSVSQSVS